MSRKEVRADGDEGQDPGKVPRAPQLWKTVQRQFAWLFES